MSPLQYVLFVLSLGLSKGVMLCFKVFQVMCSSGGMHSERAFQHSCCCGWHISVPICLPVHRPCCTDASTMLPVAVQVRKALAVRLGGLSIKLLR